MIKRTAIAALMILLATTPTSAQVAGCYDVSVGEWSPMPGDVHHELPPPDATSDSLLYAFPPRVELGEGGLVGIPAAALATVHDRLSWRVPAGDSLIVHLGWKAYAGVNAHLRHDELGWRGQSRTWAHTPGQRRYGQPVLLRRVDCSSPPPIRADEDQWVPLDIELGTEVITVGGRTDLEDGLHELDLPAPGIRGDFAGAWRAEVRVEDGRVVRARLYSPEAALAGILERTFRSEDRNGYGLMRSNRSGTVLHWEGVDWITVTAQPGRLVGGSP